MGRLGWLVFLAYFVQFRLDDRSVLFPFFALAGLIELRRVASYRALSRSRWFEAARACGVVAAVAGFVALVPVVEPGGLSAIATASAGFAVFCWAGVLHDWSVAQGWSPPAEKAASARRWLLAGAVAFVLWLAAYVAAVEPGPALDDRYSPSALFGRPVEGWTPPVAILVTAVLSIVGFVKLRRASQAIRHSLRLQPDGVLVGT
jgi:hypothetical protein